MFSARSRSAQSGAGVATHRLAGPALFGALVVLPGCTAVSEQERQEEAAWNGCIDREIAARRGADGRLRSPGREVYFEVTYACRATFPDWDKAGHSRRARSMLTGLYHRLATSAGQASQ